MMASASRTSSPSNSVATEERTMKAATLPISTKPRKSLGDLKKHETIESSIDCPTGSEQSLADNNGVLTNKETSTSTSTLVSAMQLFGKIASKLSRESTEEKPEEDQKETDTTENSEQPDPTSALRVFSKVAALPSLLADKVKSSQSKKIESGELINLTFLTDQERSVIQKVIQADLRLRRTILGSLRKNIDEAQKSQDKENTEDDIESKPGLACSHCGQSVPTICTRVLAGKCSDCGRVICKRCTGTHTSKFYTLPSLCLACKKRRVLRLQTLDYESILYYGNGEKPIGEDTPVYAESELIKKSLQAAVNLTKPQKSVDFASESKGKSKDTGSLPRSYSTGNEDLQPRTRKRSSSLQTSPFVKSQTLPVELLERPKSCTPAKQLTIPSIGDADCGFHLLSKASDESLVDLCSVYSEQCYFGEEITGRILLGLWYKAEERRLYIRIVKAEKLASAADGALDPYVKTYLLPGVYKSNKRKTGLQYDTTKPVWDEILKYAGLTQEDVCSRTLWVSIWDWNRYGRQQFLGEVRIPLVGRDLTNSKDEWFKLQDSENKPTIETDEVDGPDQPPKPRVLLAIKFDPYNHDELARLRSDKAGTLGCFQIKIRRAENLPAMDIDDRTDSFVRCFLLPNMQLGGKKKSKVIDNSLNPIWEDEIEYTYLSLEELTCERALEVTVWDYDRRGTNQFIGGVRIGPNPFDVIHAMDWMDSTDTESLHWEDMLDRPGEWVEAWHTLRPSMDSLHKLKEKMKIHEGSMSSGSIPIEPSTANGRDTPTISCPLHTPAGNQNMEVNISRSGKGNYKITGEILTGIKYYKGFLYVKVIKAAGLAAVHRNRTSNPYVKVYLLPDRSKNSKKKTEVKKRTLDPVFKQVFKYAVDPADIQMRTLWVTVWNYDSITTNLFMGETCISLAGDLRHSSERWYELHDFAESGMVVMATPFGRTPLHKGTKETSQEGTRTSTPAKLSGEDSKLIVEDQDPSTSLSATNGVGMDIPDTPPQEIARIPEVNVQNYEEQVNT